MNDLSEREKKFLKMICDHTGGDISQMVLKQDLYPLAERNRFNKHEVTSISFMLRGLGLIEKQSYKGVKEEGDPPLMIACVRLTPAGVLYARNLD